MERDGEATVQRQGMLVTQSLRAKPLYPGRRSEGLWV